MDNLLLSEQHLTLLILQNKYKPFNEDEKEIACTVLKRNWKINLSGINTISLQFKVSPTIATLLAENPKVGLIKKTETNTIFIPVQYDERSHDYNSRRYRIHFRRYIYNWLSTISTNRKFNHKSQKVCLESTISLSATPQEAVGQEKELQDQRLTHP